MRSFVALHYDHLIVFCLLVAGFIFNVYAPLWLAPPFFGFTIWLYVVLLYAWIPAYFILRRGKGRAGLFSSSLSWGQCW